MIKAKTILSNIDKVTEGTFPGEGTSRTDLSRMEASAEALSYRSGDVNSIVRKYLPGNKVIDQLICHSHFVDDREETRYKSDYEYDVEFANAWAKILGGESKIEYGTRFIFITYPAENVPKADKLYKRSLGVSPKYIQVSGQPKVKSGWFSGPGVIEDIDRDFDTKNSKIRDTVTVSRLIAPSDEIVLNLIAALTKTGARVKAKRNKITVEIDGQVSKDTKIIDKVYSSFRADMSRLNYINDPPDWHSS